jgi:hypothetical protein
VSARPHRGSDIWGAPVGGGLSMIAAISATGRPQFKSSTIRPCLLTSGAPDVAPSTNPARCAASGAVSAEFDIPAFSSMADRTNIEHILAFCKKMSCFRVGSLPCKVAAASRHTAFAATTPFGIVSRKTAATDFLA